ncbi:MAG: hypothetical protein AAGA56_01610, partial [Myxococcota bacterium]
FTDNTEGLVVLEKIIRPGERPHRTTIANNWFCALENVGVRLVRGVVDAELFENTFVDVGMSFVTFQDSPGVVTYRDNLFVGEGVFPPGDNQHVPDVVDANFSDVDACDLRVNEDERSVIAGASISEPGKIGIQQPLCPP